MAWIAADKDGRIFIYEKKPLRQDNYFALHRHFYTEPINASICMTVLGRVPTWNDEPVEIIQAPSKGEG